MIGPTGAVKVMVATKPVDFRKGAEGLAALVRAAGGWRVPLAESARWRDAADGHSVVGAA